MGNDSQLVLPVGRGEEVIEQAHAEHGDSRLLHQHGTGPQEQAEQQEERGGRGREARALEAPIQTPARQAGLCSA